ncbi:FHA domain-containing protein [Aquihabitans sp. McL0605]|uniref:FHA domain-containing protein n=1 Tax=Aquihabitans sp. McL0605 TaxID=3415671 RepID=UPI003CEC16AF
MSDVFCSNCGHANQAGSNFCSSCGQPLERVDEEPPTITFSLDSESGEELHVDLGSVGPGGRLVVTRGPNTGAEFDLEHVITTAGRHPDSDIFLDDVTVSRRHVEIERTTSGSVVRDVGSLNGTYLNQQRIDGDVPIHNGDELQVGKFKLLFVAGEAS